MRDLVFSDGPMFQRLMSHEHICRGVVERITGMEVVEVERIVTEQTVEPRLGSHGVRLDAVMGADGKTYDIEVQTYRRGRIAKRLRYYQASLDVTALGKGHEYDLLPDTYVIFICTDDFVGTRLPVSTLGITCEEQPTFDCGHGFKWVILDASRWREVSRGPLRDLLMFVDTGIVPEHDELLSLIDREMAVANTDAAWKEDVMPFLTLEEDAKIQARISYEDGKAEGLAEGQELMALLVQKLLADERISDINRAVSDPTVRAQLCAEYGL